MRWDWDDEKDRSNQRKHRLSFKTAELVFNDPLAVSRRDHHLREERWQTIGSIGSVVVLVVHTYVESTMYEDENGGRIISARKATRRERKKYEEGDF